MIALNERTVLSALLAIIGVSAFFCLLGLATPGWSGGSLFEYGRSSTRALAIISLLLLIGSLVLAALIFGNVIPHPQLPLLFVALLFVSCIFLIGTIGSLFESSTVLKVYSPSLIMVALSFGYFSSLLSVYWLFGVRSSGGEASAPSRPKQAQVTMSEGNY